MEAPVLRRKARRHSEDLVPLFCFVSFKFVLSGIFGRMVSTDSL